MICLKFTGEHNLFTFNHGRLTDIILNNFFDDLKVADRKVSRENKRVSSIKLLISVVQTTFMPLYT